MSEYSLVHDQAVSRVQFLCYGLEGHAVFCGEDDKLEVWVAEGVQEHVHPRALLKTPAMLVLQNGRTLNMCKLPGMTELCKNNGLRIKYQHLPTGIMCITLIL